MNKPATKEPSMDEILSSIRQIIADDDAATAPVPAAPRPAAVPPPAVSAAPAQPRPVPAQVPRAAAAPPLALSAAQIVPPAASTRGPEPVPVARMAEPPEPANEDFSAMLAGLDEPEPDVSAPIARILADEPELVDPEDIAFEPEMLEPEPPALWAPEPEPQRAPEPPRPMASVAQAAPMPDPDLSADMAEELLAPATDAAVQGTMSRLAAMTAGGIGGMTVEAMMRDMLRPMLKDWLDENLPSLVERMVEKEIARISRGVK